MSIEHILYNIIVTAANTLLRPAGAVRSMLSKGEDSKFQRFVRYQKDSKEGLEKARPEHTLWVHVASMGEFAVVRPLIKELRERGCYIVLTFFSPTGYDALGKSGNNFADEIRVLPADTPANARRFIDSIKPQKAVFAVSEIWINYIHQLRLHNIPAYLVSAKITPRSIAMRWYGGLFRKAMKSFKAIMVLDDISKKLLEDKGFKNAVRTGDILFDNAQNVANTEYSNPTIEKFCENRNIFIAGSINDRNDLELVSHLANRNKDTKFLFVPHEITGKELKAIEDSLQEPSIRYSECDESTDFNHCQVLIIDFIGALAYIYRYCAYAYIGGGFTPYLHSILEPAVYGMPMSFGPKIHRKNAAKELIELKAAEMVTNKDEIGSWFKKIKNNETALKEIKQRELEFVNKSSGATATVTNIILK